MLQENPDAELQGKLLAEDPNPIDTAKRTLKKELQKVQAAPGLQKLLVGKLYSMPYDQMKSVRALNPYCAILEVLKNNDVFVQETQSGVLTYFIFHCYSIS